MDWKFFLKYKVEIMGIYERLIHLVIGNSLKSASSIYSYLARISTFYASLPELVQGLV